MSFGFEMLKRIAVDDTNTLTAPLYDETGEQPIPAGDITAVTFTIKKPDGTIVGPLAGDVIGDGKGQVTIDASVHAVAGPYLCKARFSYTEGVITGKVKTVADDYDVWDPFVSSLTSTNAAGAVDKAWTALEDCFDSEEGGPWLRDMTKGRFDKDKLASLSPQVMLEINYVMPITTYSVELFPYAANDGEALFAQGLLVAGIRHLMRSYTEQPDIIGGQINFADRKRYQQAWKAIYDVEQEAYKRWLELWKRQFFDMSHSALLVGVKAGRLMPAPMRTRYVGRGFGGT